MKKILDYTFILIICVFCLTFFIGGFLLPDKEFSENENRYLTNVPTFTLSDIFSGKYMNNMENYLNDQMPLRDEFISFRTTTQRLLGFENVNGVYFGKDGYLFEEHLEQNFPYEQLEKNINTVNQFAKNNDSLKVSVMIIPTADLIISEKLPEHAPSFPQDPILDDLKENLKSLHYLDIRDALELHDDSYIYYKTDHHWTALGAYFAYEEWCRQNCLSVSLSEFEAQTVTDSFRGSLYSKVLNTDCAYDSIELYTLQNEPTYTVYYNFGKTQSNSCYEPEHLREKDKYQVFLNGNHPEVTIQTEQKNGKHLLILKDSFANAFIPYLIPHYESIHIVDLRYFNQDINTYIQENNINEVLFLFNIINFAEDKNFVKLISD